MNICFQFDCFDTMGIGPVKQLKIGHFWLMFQSWNALLNNSSLDLIEVFLEPIVRLNRTVLGKKKLSCSLDKSSLNLMIFFQGFINGILRAAIVIPRLEDEFSLKCPVKPAELPLLLIQRHLIHANRAYGRHLIRNVSLKKRAQFFAK